MTDHNGTSWLEVEMRAATSIWYPVTISTPDPSATIPQRFSAPEANRTVETIQANRRDARIVRCWPDGTRDIVGPAA